MYKKNERLRREFFGNFSRFVLIIKLTDRGSRREDDPGLWRWRGLSIVKNMRQFSEAGNETKKP